jgi:hypothetical protein
MNLKITPSHWLLLITIVAVFLFGAVFPVVAWAEDLVSIGEILADPDLFHLRHVTFQGTVKNVVQLDPYFQTTEAAGVVCYGAYAFQLADSTGAIDVGVLGFCGVPIIRPPAVADGDQATVTVQIHAPGRTGAYLDLFGRFIPAGDRQVRSIASHISKLEK